MLCGIWKYKNIDQDIYTFKIPKLLNYIRKKVLQFVSTFRNFISANLFETCKDPFFTKKRSINFTRIS